MHTARGAAGDSGYKSQSVQEHAAHSVDVEHMFEGTRVGAVPNDNSAFDALQHSALYNTSKMITFYPINPHLARMRRNERTHKTSKM
jgi:hypothetical protein